MSAVHREEYMQMAGRAGRRSRDKKGNAWSIITRSTRWSWWRG